MNMKENEKKGRSINGMSDKEKYASFLPCIHCRPEYKEAVEKTREGSVTVNLEYTPPYDWERMLQFFALRLLPGVEAIREGAYIRALRMTAPSGTVCEGWVRAVPVPEKDQVEVTVSKMMMPVLPEILRRVRRLFDLDCDPGLVYEMLEPMEAVCPGVRVLGTRLPGAMEPFEISVRAVLGQWVTVKAACTLAGRITEFYGTPVKTPWEDVCAVFPTPEDILAFEGIVEAKLGSLGVTGYRAKAIRGLAELFADGRIPWEGKTASEAIKELESLTGIGPWTANYIAMRAMSWPDAFLETDYGVKEALRGLKPKEIKKLAEAWSPWRSYAVVNLWNSLG